MSAVSGPRDVERGCTRPTPAYADSVRPDPAARTDEPPVSAEQAAALLAAKDFAAARAAHLRLLADGDDPALLEGLGLACRALGDIRGSVDAYERAYQLWVVAGAGGAAGVVATTLADLELTELGGSAVAAGWLARARHHLGTDPDHPGHVALEALCAYRALAYEKDPIAAHAFASRSVAHARRVGDGTGEIMGKAFLGFTAVSQGDLAHGFDLLDEATAAALAGELPPLADLDVYCLLITACERVRDLDRADQWAQRVLSMATGSDARAFATFARTQYASLLIMRGRWAEATVHLDRVIAHAEDHPMTAAMAMVLRSALSRRQGRLDQADIELRACEREPYRRAVRHLVLAARASLELERGNAQEAADLAERYLHAVAPADLVERVDGLEVLARARLTLNDLGAADAAVGELESVAASVPTAAIRAVAASTRAELDRARGRLEQAKAALDAAVTGLDDIGLTPDALRARVSLAHVLLELGDAGSARRTAEVARQMAVELGAAGDLAATTDLLRCTREGAPPAPHDLTPREVEVLRLVADGLTNADIAARLVLSPRTVERHVSNIYLKLGVVGSAGRTVAVAHARRTGVVR